MTENNLDGTRPRNHCPKCEIPGEAKKYTSYDVDKLLDKIEDIVCAYRDQEKLTRREPFN